MKKRSYDETLNKISILISNFSKNTNNSKDYAYEQLNKLSKLLNNLSINEKARTTFELLNNDDLNKLFRIIIPADTVEFNFALIPSEYNNDRVKDLINSYCENNDIKYSFGYEEESTNIKYTESVNLLYEDFGKFELLTKEKEQELAKKISKGDKNARELLINSNGRLVFSVARHFMGRGLEFEDLVSYGLQGLIKCADKFDAEKECRFSTYATWWIRQSIKRGIMDSSSIIRKPSQIHLEKERIEKAKQEIMYATGKEPTSKEVSIVLGISEERVSNFEKYFQSVSYLDAPLKKDEESGTLADAISSEDNNMETDLEDKMKNDEIRSFFRKSKLTDREKNIISKRFGLDGSEPQKLEDIGNQYGLTRERIRQIEKRALIKLSKSAKLNKISQYGYIKPVQQNSKKEEKKEEENIDISKIKKMKKSKPLYTDRQLNPIVRDNLYDYLNSYAYTDEEIDIALKRLNKKDLKSLIIKYGKDFHKPYKRNLTFEQNMAFSLAVINLMNILIDMEHDNKKEMIKK